MIRILPLIAAILLMLGASHGARAQIVLDQDFDSGSLDVAKSVVNGTEVTLEPRRFYGKDDQEWGYGVWNWVWVHFKATQVQGKTVVFRIPKDGAIYVSHHPMHRYVYSYDNETWSYFDNASVIQNDYTFSNNTPFTDDEVYVAFAIPYPAKMTEQHTEKMKTSPFVSATASADANLVIGQTAGGTDDLGRVVPQRDIYGYQITDPSATGHKQKVVLLTGVHSGEPLGNRLFQGMVDFLISSDPSAAELRQLAVFFCYPSADPDGRWAGYFRSNPETPSLNHNRHWDDPTGFTDISTITAAMRADTGGTVDYFFDCHNHFGYDATYFFYYVNNNDETFYKALVQLEPTIGTTSEVDAPCTGCNVGCDCLADGWSLSSAGLSARYAYTPEAGPIRLAPPARYAELGKNYMLALLASLRAQQPSTDGGVDDGGSDGGAIADGAPTVDASIIDASDAAIGDDSGCGCVLGAVGTAPAEHVGVVLIILVLWAGRRRR